MWVAGSGNPTFKMRYLITVILTAVITSVVWLFAVSYIGMNTPVTAFIQNIQYQRIKQQKELEFRAEMEMFGGKEALKQLDSWSKGVPNVPNSLQNPLRGAK